MAQFLAMINSYYSLLAVTPLEEEFVLFDINDEERHCRLISFKSFLK